MKDRTGYVDEIRGIRKLEGAERGVKRDREAADQRCVVVQGAGGCGECDCQRDGIG